MSESEMRLSIEIKREVPSKQVAKEYDTYTSNPQQVGIYPADEMSLVIQPQLTPSMSDV